jgi:hypothetical protein
MGIKLIRSSPYYAQANGQAKRPIRAWSSWSKGRLMNTHGVGMKYYQKRDGLIVFHATGQQELHHIIWCMGRRPYYHGKLRPVRDG